MNELIKPLVDRLLGWPIVVLVICLIFRPAIGALFSEFTAFIRRASQLSFKHKDTSLEATSSANPQVKNDSTEFDLGAGTAISVSKDAVPEDVTRDRSALIDYGKGVASVQAREEMIRAELRRLGFNLDDLETVDMLIRQLATQQCLSFFERTYRLIFGSQISAMEFLNTQGAVKASFIETVFFNTARNLEETFYADITFEQWLAYLLNNLLLAQDGEDLAISVGGRDFLVWMVNSGLPNVKPH